LIELGEWATPSEGGRAERIREAVATASPPDVGRGFAPPVD
jgi:hypothetical protein